MNAPARLFVTTRDRPEALLALVGYLERFYPDTAMIVADASDAAGAARNHAALTDPARIIAADHHPLRADMARDDMIRAVLRDIDDPFVILCPDDAFPVMETLRRAEAALAAEADALAAVGSAVELHAPSADDVTATLHVGRPLTQKKVDLRLNIFARWQFATRRGVVRRALLLERLDAGAPTDVPQLAEFGERLRDIVHGPVALVPDTAFLIAPHARPPLPPLDVFAQSSAILALIGALKADVVARTDKTGEDAERFAESIVRMGVAEAIGAEAIWQRGFDTARPFLHGSVDRQFEAFEALLRDGTLARKALEPQLRYAVDAARARACPGTVAPPGALAPVRSMRDAVRRLDPDTLRMAADGPPLHILALGQSNLASHGDGPSRSAFGAALVDGVRLPLADPVPGGSGTGASLWPRLAARIARDGLAPDLLVSLRATGGTAMADWAEGGVQYEALRDALPALAALPHPPQLVVWHQGEMDAHMGTPAFAYRAGFDSLFALVQQYLPQARWLVCRASLVGGKTDAALIEAQEEIIDTHPMCLGGPNTDILTGHHRADGTHLSADGLEAFADMLADAVTLALRT